MINLQNFAGQASNPFKSYLSHQRLYIDFQELFDFSKRIFNYKCSTEFDSPVFSDNMFIINASILCNEGLYKGICFKVKNSSILPLNLTFQLRIFISKDYPFDPPKIVSFTKLSHPNINYRTGEVNLTVVKENEWLPIYK